MTERLDEQLNEDVSTLAETEMNVSMDTVAEEDDGGTIQISKLALLSVVKKYVMAIDGVIRFQNQSLMDGMLDIISSKRSDRSIIIETPDKGAEITVTVVMRFGVRIPDVAHQIQQILREKVEELTGYTVSKVNVNVSDLEEIKPQEPKQEPVKAEKDAEQQTSEQAADADPEPEAEVEVETEESQKAE